MTDPPQEQHDAATVVREHGYEPAQLTPRECEGLAARLAEDTPDRGLIGDRIDGRNWTI